MVLTAKKATDLQLACPIDRTPLTLHQAQLKCLHGHCYDVARQGYVNLLGAADKRSKNPGDSKEMVLSRSRVLASGFYQPISDALVKVIKQYKDESAYEMNILDAGCGEGYYLNRVGESLVKSHCLGIDISKDAIQQAAKSVSNSAWLVASNRCLPVADRSVDVLICAFGFPDFIEFKRVLKSNGILVMVDPAALHLLELRKLIYPVIKPYQANAFDKAVEAGFSLDTQRECTFEGDANKQTLEDILRMSPHLYRASIEGKQRVQALEGLKLTMDVLVSVLR